MPDVIISTVKILIGFIICLGVIWYAFKFAIIGLLTAGEGFLGSGDKKKGLPILISGICIGLLIFPFGAWFLQNDLRLLQPNWLPQNTLPVIFGFSPLIIFVVAKVYGNYYEYQRNYHPRDGEQKKYYKTGELFAVLNWNDGELHGESVFYCKNKEVFRKIKYEYGKEIGEFFETECGAEFFGKRTTKYFKPAGKLFSEKQFVGYKLKYEMYREDKKEFSFSYDNDGRLTGKSIKEFEINKYTHQETWISSYAQTFDALNGNLTMEVIDIYEENYHEHLWRSFNAKTGEIIKEQHFKNGRLVNAESDSFKIKR